MTGTVLDIEERAEAFALRAVKVFRYLQKQKDAADLILGRQFLRSATSVGANLIEARSGESRRDFVHKCSIAQKEARETRYWLRLLVKADLIPPVRLAGMMDETEQIIAIVTAIIVKAKRRPTN